MQKKINNPPLLLDTHIWLWLNTADEKLEKSPMLKDITRAAQENRLLLSIISIWEFGVLVSKKRFSIDLPPLEWIESSIQQSSITLVDLTPKIVLQPAVFFGNFHGDPADRIILATAIEQGAILATQDKRILHYAAQEMIPTISL